jgi:hypothetical protein
VLHRALEQIRHRRQTDVRMRPHIVVVFRPRVDRAEVVEEDEGADSAPCRGRQQTTHGESAAEILVVRSQKLHGAMVGAPTIRAFSSKTKP